MSKASARAPMGRPIARHLRQLVQLLWVMFLLICVTAVGSLHLVSDEVDRLTLALGPAVDANEQVLRAMTDAQTGLSGYELSQDRAMLQPFFGAQARTETALVLVREKLALAHPDSAETSLHDGLEASQSLATKRWWAFALTAERSLALGQRTDVFQGRALFNKFAAANAALGAHVTAERNSSRQSARNLSWLGSAATIVITLAALLAAFALGRRAVSAISRPLAALRDTVTRQREGEVDVRANMDQDSTEMRSLAINFNALTEQNIGLLKTQEHALNMSQLTFGIARAIRGSSDTQQALEVMCVALGEGLGVDRVIAHTVDAAGQMQLSAQWHPPELTPLGEMSADLHLHLARLARDIWLSEGVLARPDFLSAEVQSRERSRVFYRETGARAVIMAPIGLGDRVIGLLHVLTVDEPRAWTESESRIVHQVAGFAARAIVNADDQAHQSEYVERLERLDEQKSDFLATVSHELRTPLTSISGYLELLEDGDVGGMTAQQDAVLEVIGRNTARLRSLIEDLLVLNRIESGVKKLVVSVSMHDLLIHAGQELAPLARRAAVELDINAGSDLLFVQGDRGSLDRAIVNVVSNAIKFSHPEGVVTITSTLSQSRRRVLITCQDRGIGIPAQDQLLMFTRFHRASNARDQAIPGTGLGLSIVKQIVEEHGGELRLTSTEGSGTTVVIGLPLFAPEAGAGGVGNDSQPAYVSAIVPDLAH